MVGGQMKEIINGIQYILVRKSQRSYLKRYCSDFKSNPQIYRTAKIGSRNSHTIFYWDSEKCMVRCGCFWNTLEEFEKRVKRVHSGNAHEKSYLKEIEKVKALLKED